jgi:hypothetical protein
MAASPKRPRWSRLLFTALVVVALAAGALWSIRVRSVPREVVLYVLDRRAPDAAPPGVEQLYPGPAQAQDGIRLVVRRVAPAQTVASLPELFAAFERTAREPDTHKLFVRLPTPSAASHKALRDDIERHQPFSGEARARLLERVIPIVGVDTAARHLACEQFGADWAYARWNFGGFGLEVGDETLALLGECLPKVARQAAERPAA